MNEFLGSKLSHNSIAITYGQAFTLRYAWYDWGDLHWRIHSFVFKKVDYECALAKQVSCVQVPAQLTLQGHVHITVSYKSTIEYCQSTSSPQQRLYFKKSLLQENITQFLKFVLTRWGLLNYTYYLFISRIQVAHLTDILQSCFNTSATRLLQRSDSHLLYKANKNWITLRQNPSTVLQARKP